MKVPLLSLLLISVVLSHNVYSQANIVACPGEYQGFFINTTTHIAYALGGTQTTMGVGTNTGAIGTLIPMQFPAGVQVKSISSGLHGGNAVDMNGNVWFWGLNDGGMACNGTVGGAITLAPIQITVDTFGNPFTNVSQISSFWWDDGSDNNENSSGVLAVKNDGTVWIWGNTHGGFRGNGQVGQETYAPVQINFPGNPHIVKVLAGDICMALDNNGNVYTWGGDGRNTLLGTNTSDYVDVQKVTLPKPAKDIAGAQMFAYALATDGTLYGWGIYGAYLGIGTGPYLSCNTFQPLPVDLTSDLNLPHPVSKIMCNSICTHVILTDSTLWGWGDNTQGNVGNGQEIVWATYPTPYAWDWGAAEVLQNKPAQIMPLVHNFTAMYAGAAACFYNFAQDATGQLYSWGRNKGVVQANQVAPATSNINAQYPDAWDQPTITAVNPFAVTASTVYLSTCVYCLLNPTTTPCNGFTIPSDVPPVSVPGPNQTITLPTTTTILDGSGSHDPDGTVVYYKWRQVSGPSANTVLDSTYHKTRIAGLVAGTYVYSLTVTDNGWDSTKATMTVIVQNASGNVAPTVSAGSNQTIELPVSSATLTGTAAGNNGATISSTAWTLLSGPVPATISAASSLSTGVSGLTTAGTYTFQLKATDNNGLSTTATVTITVQAAPSAPPTVSAGSVQTIQLPVSSVTLTGTATGNDGATISSTAWTEVSGPVTATIAAASGLSTGVTGLTTAGTYVFQLKATENNGLSTTATVTITVQAAPSAPPTVSAGSAQTIQLPVSSVTLTGTATGNDGATISSTAWTEVSGPVTATIAAASGLSTGVTGLTTAGTYVFQLKATDNNGLSATATVVITVEAAAPPVNVPPTVSAGSDQTIQLPVSSATLSGTATGNGGATISSKVWTEVSGPVTATIATASALSTGVSGLTTAGSYVFELKATDNNGLSTTSAMTITVEAAAAPPPVHTPPVANAGSNQTVTLPFTYVALDGSASYDVDGTIVSYSWVQTAGNGGVTIVGSSQVQPSVYGLTPGTYVFQLTVTDNTGATGVATVTITVNAAVVQAPVANAGADTTIALPANSVMLNGSGSTDPGGETLTYQWSQLSGPGTAVIGSAEGATTTVSQLQAGLYVFELTVTNTSGLTDTATVQVRVVNNERTADTASAQFTVYPNPVQSMLTVRFASLQTGGQVMMKIFDMKGVLVMSQQTKLSGATQSINFNVSGLARGAYALQVIVGSAQAYQLIIKQ